MNRRIVGIRWDLDGYTKISRPAAAGVRVRRLAMPEPIRRDIDRRPDRWVLDGDNDPYKIAAAGMGLLAAMVEMGRRKLNYKTGRTRK